MRSLGAAGQLLSNLPESEELSLPLHTYKIKLEVIAFNLNCASFDASCIQINK